MLNHICAKKNEGNYRGGERTTPVMTACMSRSWNHQQGARQVRRNTNIFVSYVPTRPLALGRQTITATESGTTATTKHANLQKVFSGKKNTKRVRCDTGRMHATHWFLPWILSTFTTTFARRSLTTRETIIFPLIFCVENVW